MIFESRFSLCVLLSLLSLWSGPLSARAALADAGPIFGKLPLVDEVDCGQAPGSRIFTESKKGDSVTERILGKSCRVLPNEGGPKYFAYRLGKGKGLKPGAAYLLTVEFPEDKPRTIYISNRGSETARGFYTGNALGDGVYYKYVNNNAESLKIPLAGKYELYQELFYLHDRFAGIEVPRDKGLRPLSPEDGFDVIVAQVEAKSDPTSAGAAVARIRLFEVPDPQRFNLKANRPPEDLPQRHIFFREEMADNMINSADEKEWAVEDRTNWFEYQARLLQFLGIDTFCKDLLEFGHNQGWDSGSKDDWFNKPRHSDRWDRIIAMLSERFPSLYVMPYYEYAGGTGSNGIGRQKRSKTLNGGESYTHIKWSEKFNADVTDPETLADLDKVFDATITRYKDKVKFAGAWIRPRNSHMPMSFSDRCLDLFATEANEGNPVTREELKGDPELLKKYETWWFQKRRDFLAGAARYLRENVSPDAKIVFTADHSEPGRPLELGGIGFHRYVVTDDVELWTKLLKEGGGKARVADIDEVVKNGEYLKAQLAPVPTWAEWEWNYSSPQPDPANYQDVDGVLVSYAFNKIYTVSSPEAFDAFRNNSGLAAIRHYSLNEHTLDRITGYFVTDVDRAGPYGMLPQVLAVANGDPTMLGYLSSAIFNQGFPEYFRDFNAAYLALPALPSKVVADATATPGVVVRQIPTPAHGTYLAVANTGLTAQPNVIVRLPAKGKVTNAATGESLPVSADGTSVKLAMKPCQLQSLRIE